MWQDDSRRLGPTLGWAAQMAKCAMDARVSRYDVTPVQTHVLMYLNQHGGQVPQRELTEFMRAKPSTVNGVLETARKEKKIGKSLEAKVTLQVADPDNFLLPEMDEDAMADVFIVSQVALKKGSGELAVDVAPAEGEKCQRCWKVLPTVSGDLCPRCARVIRG